MSEEQPSPVVEDVAAKDTPVALIAALSVVRQHTLPAAESPYLPTQVSTAGDPDVLSAFLQPLLPSDPSHQNLTDYFANDLLNEGSALAAETDDMIWVVENPDLEVMMEQSEGAQEQQRPPGLSSPGANEVTKKIDRILRASKVSVIRRERSTYHFNKTGDTDGEDKTEKKKPSIFAHPLLSRPNVHWYASLALNLVTQWPYTLTIAVVRVLPLWRQLGGKQGQKYMVVLRHVSKRVYATPMRAQMHCKAGTGPMVDGGDGVGHGHDGADHLDFPYVHFNVDDFEGELETIKLNEGLRLAVLLSAGNDQLDSEASIFRGILDYESIMGCIKDKFSGDKSGGAGQQIPDRLFIPLRAQSGKSEIAVTLPHFEREWNESPVRAGPGGKKTSNNNRNSSEKSSTSIFSKAKKGLGSLLFGGGGGSSSGQVDAAGDNGGQRSGGGGDGAPIVHGNEVLHCSVTHACVHVGHVLSVLLKKALPPTMSTSNNNNQTSLNNASNPSSPNADGDGSSSSKRKSSKTPTPWWVFAKDSEQLTEWLELFSPRA